jgi:HSP20 family molecular chaperone IbpA
MSHVTINKVNGAKEAMPIFEEMGKRLEAVKCRAFEIFEGRGRREGYELDDWLKAEHELLGWPAAELCEKEGAYEIEVALPGFEAKEIEITASSDELIVHAATQKQKEETKGNVVWSEFGSNDVYRRFVIPNAINTDKVTAKLENGILRILAPSNSPPKASSVAA